MGPVTELCMGCLCEASTDCNRNFQCDGGYCGMFRISAPYWRDAGSPVKKGDNATTVAGKLRLYVPVNRLMCLEREAKLCLTALSCFSIRALRDGPILCRAHSAGIHDQVSQGEQDVIKEGTFLKCQLASSLSHLTRWFSLAVIASFLQQNAR